MRQNRSYGVVYVLLGAITGCALSLVITAWRTSHTQSPDNASVDRRLSGLENGVRQLALTATTQALGAPRTIEVPIAVEKTEPARPGAPATTLAGRAERLSQLRAMDDEKIRKHWSDPIDRDWSGMAAPSLRTRLEAMAKDNRFQVLDVDCKTTSCIASFRWPTRPDAEVAIATIAHEPFDVNCARGITLPETDDPSQPVQATMIFDCTQWKAEGNKMISTAP